MREQHTEKARKKWGWFGIGVYRSKKNGYSEENG